MALVVNATPGDPAANSYLTLGEAQAYFDSRLPVPGWDNADSQAVLIVMATRVIDKVLTPYKALTVKDGVSYYRIRPAWTGLPATTTQRLCWPRTGMLDQNGNVIPSDVIPQDLKDAVAELAGQLGNGDRTLDNDVIVQGLTAVRAGSVSLNFKSDIMPQVIPDAVYNLMPQSWLTDELYELANQAFIEVISGHHHHHDGDIW